MTDEHRGLGRHVGQVVQQGGALVGVHLFLFLIILVVVVVVVVVVPLFLMVFGFSTCCWWCYC